MQLPQRNPHQHSTSTSTSPHQGPRQRSRSTSISTASPRPCWCQPHQGQHRCPRPRCPHQRQRPRHGHGRRQPRQGQRQCPCRCPRQRRGLAELATLMSLRVGPRRTWRSSRRTCRSARSGQLASAPQQLRRTRCPGGLRDARDPPRGFADGHGPWLGRRIDPRQNMATSRAAHGHPPAPGEGRVAELPPNSCRSRSDG